MSLAEGYGSPAELQQQVFGLREEVNRLRAELAKLREQEPVAEVAKGNLGPRLMWCCLDTEYPPVGTKLYTHPAPRVE